jgi:hypothetical protein
MVSEEAKQDAEVIKQILTSDNGDDGLDEILKLLCQRSKDARQQIKRAYRTQFKEEMQDIIAKAHKGTDNVLSAVLHLPEDLDAKELYGSMKGLGTDEPTLTEILCTRTNEEIKDAGYSFRHWYGTGLKEMVTSETSGDYKAILTGLLQANRDETGSGDSNVAARIAQSLSDKKNDDENFVQVLTTQSYPMIRAVATEYAQLAGKTFEEGLKKEFGGDAETAALSIYRVANGKEEYLADIVHDTVKNGKVEAVLRICGSREDKDLHRIKQEFLTKYNKPMDDFVDDYIKDKKAGKAKDVTLMLIRSAQ